MKPLSWYKELSSGRKRAEYRMFLAEGMRAIRQIQSADALAVEEILAVESASGEAASFSRPVRIVTERQFRAISSLQTPQGVAATARIPEHSFSADPPPDPGRTLLLLEGVQDPGNVGTLIRTAAALGFDGAVLSETCADPFSPKSVQASAGSILSLWIRRTGRYADLAQTLRRKGFSLIAADPRGEQATPAAFPGFFVVMLGGEGAGLSSMLLDLADKKIAIPMEKEKAESLNVAVAGGILMFIGTSAARQPFNPG